MSAGRTPRAPVRVEIGVLSLAGVSRNRGAAVGAALRAELARVLGTEAAQRQLREFAAAGGTAARIDAGHMSARAGERAEKLGTRIATQVAGGLSGATAVRGRR